LGLREEVDLRFGLLAQALRDSMVEIAQATITDPPVLLDALFDCGDIELAPSATSQVE
jgi:hypothetical protein